MSSPRRDEIVTLTSCDRLIAAQLLCGRLQAEGIECFIPDEHMANQTWHLNRAIGGIRVQVRQSDLERAKLIMAEPALGDDAAGDGANRQRSHDNGVDDESISAGDRAAYRSMRVALVSLWLIGLVHPYSLVLGVQALRRDDLTSWGRWRAWIAIGVSLLGCACLGLIVLRIVQLARR